MASCGAPAFSRFSTSSPLAPTGSDEALVITPENKMEAYDVMGVDGKTTRIDEYTTSGFVVNGLELRSSILAFPSFVVLWAASSVGDISEESLVLPLILTPPPEILLLGCGDSVDPGLLRAQYDADWAVALRRRGTTIEVLDTPNACATFNLLSEEGRRVAGAFLPVVEEGSYQD